MRKLICHPKQHVLAKLVHKVRSVFRSDEDSEWLFDLQLDKSESTDMMMESSCGDAFSSERMKI